MPTALLNPRAPFLDEPEMARTLTDPSPAVLLDITKLAVSFAVAAIDLEDSLGEETLRVLEHGERSPGEREALRSRLARLHTETDRQAMRTQARSTSGTGVYADAPYAVISWDTIHSAMYNGLLPCSGAEAAILRIALSLAEGHPVDLGPAIIRLDKRNLMYVLAAIRHASGDRSSWGTIPQDTP